MKSLLKILTKNNLLVFSFLGILILVSAISAYNLIMVSKVESYRQEIPEVKKYDEIYSKQDSVIEATPSSQPRASEQKIIINSPLPVNFPNQNFSVPIASNSAQPIKRVEIDDDEDSRDDKEEREP